MEALLSSGLGFADTTQQALAAADMRQETIDPKAMLRGPKSYSLHRTDYAQAIAAAVAPSRKDTNSSGAVPAAPAVPACVASSPEKQIWRADHDIHTDYYFARNNSFCKTCDCPYFEYTLYVTGEDLESDQEFQLSEFSTMRAFSIWFIVLWEW